MHDPSIKPLHGVLHYVKENVMWTAAEGALTLLYLGVATDELVAKQIRGKYYHPQSIPVDHPLTQGEAELPQKLWQFCDELLKEFASFEEAKEPDEKPQEAPPAEAEQTLEPEQMEESEFS